MLTLPVICCPILFCFVFRTGVSQLQGVDAAHRGHAASDGTDFDRAGPRVGGGYVLAHAFGGQLRLRRKQVRAYKSLEKDIYSVKCAQKRVVVFVGWSHVTRIQNLTTDTHTTYGTSQ